MRGVKYVTYAFVAIISLTVIVSLWVGRYSKGNAKRHTDTFLRVLSSCSILLTFVFYYNLIKSEDDSRMRAEQQDTDRELDRRSAARQEMIILFEKIPFSIKSIVELNPFVKFEFARRAVEKKELDKGLSEWRLNSIVFDLWSSDINLFTHRNPDMVNRTAIMITQALSPIVRSAWHEYSYQYSQPMREFVKGMYVIIDESISELNRKTPNYNIMALKLLANMEHLDVFWDDIPPYYQFKPLEYVKDKVRHYF